MRGGGDGRRRVGAPAVAVVLALGILWMGAISAAPAGAKPKPKQDATTTTTAAPAASDDDPDEPWLAALALGVALVMGAVLTVVVHKDRESARKAERYAISKGIVDLGETDANVGREGILATSGGEKPFAIEPSTAVVPPDTTVRLRAKKGDDEVLVDWSVDKADVLRLHPDKGRVGSVDATALKPGAATVTATDGTTPVTARVEVVATAASGKVRFSVLGAGLGSILVALLAVGGGVALAFVGGFSSEVGTLLGVAVGAGAVAAGAAGANAGGATDGGAGGKDDATS